MCLEFGVGEDRAPELKARLRSLHRWQARTSKMSRMCRKEGKGRTCLGWGEHAE